MYWNRFLLCCAVVGSAMFMSETRAAGEAVTEAYFAEDRQLAELIARLLEENPQILAARELWKATEQRLPQARSLPDPRLSYRLFAETPETRVGPQRQGLELSQDVPWFGKRGLQAQREQHLAASSRWDLRALERSLVAELKGVYFDAVYVREALAINAEEIALLQRFEQIALTRYATGEGIQQSVVKVQTDVTRLMDQREELEQRRDVLSRRMAYLLGRPESVRALAPGGLDLLDVSSDLAALRHEFLEEHPEVRSLAERIEADAAWVRRRGLDSRPDFRVGLGYVDVGRREDAAGVAIPPQDNGQDILSFTVGLNIPLQRKRIRAGIAEAEMRAQATRQSLHHLQNRLSFDFEESILRVETLEQRARLYEDVLVPQAEESLASSEAAYTTNRLQFLDLLDSERVLFQVRLAHQRLLADYWIALSDLERALGARFPTSTKEDRS